MSSIVELTLKIHCPELNLRVAEGRVRVASDSGDTAGQYRDALTPPLRHGWKRIKSTATINGDCTELTTLVVDRLVTPQLEPVPEAVLRVEVTDYRK